MIPEYHVSTAAQFWSELEDILSVPAQATLEQIDLAMRTFVFFCARYYHEYLSKSDHELEYAVHEFDRALQMLLESHFYNSHSDRMINIAMDLVETRHSQDSQHGTTQLHLLLRLLIQNGTQKPHVFKLLRQPRMSATRHTSRPFIQMLIEILNITEEEAHASGENSSVEGMIGSDTTILLYEVLRVKRLSSEELPLFEEKFIRHLFEIIEQTRDGDEEYNYCLVRLIIALNEQFMVAGLENHSHSHGHHHGNHKKASLPTESHNLVLKIIKDKLGNSKTFGENLIFILNRLNSSGGEASPEDLCTSLLILKILYLLFSTTSTSEYFYTNDLRVLVDVFIRELLDLPDESEGLRHTYLRVLHPLMTNTQLRTYPYKHAELRSTLLALLSNEHIRTVSPTTRRLVERNLSAEWCTALDPPPTSTQAVQAEAQLAKEMSTMALQSPKIGLLKVEEGGSGSVGQSTLSVNAVAGAEMSPVRPRKISLTSFLGKNRMSPKNPQPVPPAKEVDKQPFHYRIRRPSSKGPNEHQSQLSNSVDSVLPSFTSKKGKIPPPRPPKSGRSLDTSQSLPGTPPESADSLSADDASIKTTRSRRAPPPTPSRKRGHTQSQPENGQAS